MMDFSFEIALICFNIFDYSILSPYNEALVQGRWNCPHSMNPLST
jgi:hypothetical protein